MYKVQSLCSFFLQSQNQILQSKIKIATNTVYGYLKVTLAIGNIEVKAFIADISTELNNQLAEKLGESNIILGLTTYY